MTDKQIIIDETEINPNDWLEPYKPIPACEIKDCEHWVYAGNNVYGCRIAEDGLVCDDFNNDDECCMYRQLEYYKEALKNKEQECERLKEERDTWHYQWGKRYEICESLSDDIDKLCEQLDQLKEQLNAYKMEAEEGKEINAELKAENDELKFQNKRLDEVALYWHKRIFKFERSERKLKQTLTEIKEIAETCSFTDGSELLLSRIEQILQKISECEVGDKIKTVDLGFWDKNGEYKEDIQTVDITKE